MLTVEGMGSIPRQGIKILHATEHGQKNKKIFFRLLHVKVNLLNYSFFLLFLPFFLFFLSPLYAHSQ